MNRYLLLISAFFLTAAPLSGLSAIVTSAEYFIDVDPGPGKGTAVPASSPGATSALVINIPRPTIAALSEGVHTLACRVKDDAGNWSIAFYRTFFKEGPAEVTPPDTTPPTATISVVTPDPRNSAVNSLSIVFSEPVTGFTVADLTLTRNGGGNLLTASQTLSTSDNITFVLDGSAALTGVDGAYALVLQAANSGIADNAGNPLAADSVESWSVDQTPPTASIIAVTPDPRNSSVDTLRIIFSEAVAGLDLADLALTRNREGNLLTASQTLSTIDNSTFTLSGLGVLTAADGAYSVVLRAANSGIVDPAGNLLAADAVEMWTIDRTPPSAAIAAVTPNPRNSAVVSISIVFSESVKGFDPSDLVLTRNSGANLLSGSETLNSLDNTRFALSGVSGLTEPAGSYVLTLNAANSGISDGAGNLLTSHASVGWVVDRTPPAVSISAVAPDPRSSAVSSISIVFSEPVTGLNLPDLTLTRSNGPNLLTSAQTLTTADNITFYLGGLSELTKADGEYTLALRAVGSGVIDAVGNSLASDASTSWTMAAALIVVGEYFIDVDPGPGNGTPIAISSPAWPLSLSVNVPASVIGTLSDGPHFLTCRVRDEAGNWSVAFSRVFHRERPAPVTAAVVEFIEMQWFLDSAAASAPVMARASAPAREVSLALTASIAGLVKAGTYHLLVTPIDSLGNRGVSVSRPVFIDPSTIPSQPLTVSAFQRLPDGSLQLTFAGEAGRTYILQTSTDLRQWVDLQTSLSGNGTVRVTGADITFPQRFFRLRTQ